MESLAAPLRIERNGRFARSDRIDAVIQVLAAMTVSQSADSKDFLGFGLADLIASLNLSVGDQGQVGDAMNAALDALGIDWVRVESVSHRTGEVGSGAILLDVSLTLSDSDGVVHRQLAV